MVKIDPYKFCYLKQPCNSYIFKIYKKNLFLCGKTEKLKIAALAFFRQENGYNKMKFVRKSYISKPVKKQKTKSKKFGNILTFDKESRRKLLSLISAHSFIKNNLYI